MEGFPTFASIWHSLAIVLSLRGDAMVCVAALWRSYL